MVEEKSEIILNKGQQQIYDTVMKTNKNICINGQAGCGKSVLIDLFRKNLSDSQVLAYTGVAALNVSGITIHRYFGLFPHIKTIEDYKKMCSSRTKVPWKSIKRIIIDEISMVSPDMFILLDEICRYHTRKNIPFGGIKLILVGDWFQLPSIKDRDKECNEEDPDFIFQTDLWKLCKIETFELTEIMRQTDEEFIKILGKIRIGNIDTKVLEFIKRLESNEKDPSKHYVKLYAKNVDKNFANETELAKLKHPEVVFNAKDTGDSKYLTGHRVEEKITLKLGAVVMLLFNYPEFGLSNGSIGVIQSFERTIEGVLVPVVKFENGVTKSIVPQTFEIIKKGANRQFQLLASRTQVPLGLAYASSIHKIQGSTIANVEMFCQGIFCNAQFYVGASRCTSADTLILRNFHPDHIMVSDIADDLERLGLCK